MIKIAFEDLEFQQGIERAASISGSQIIFDTNVSFDDVDLPLTKIEEYTGIQGEYRALVYIDSTDGIELVKSVEDLFGMDIKKALNSKVIGIEVSSNVVTASIPKKTYINIEGDLPIGYIVSAVKFFMDSSHAIIKIYNLMETMTYPYPTLPEGSDLISWANYTALIDYDYPEEYDDYIDVYFLHNDHELVCSFYGKDLPKGDRYTGYGIRFSKETQELKKVKSYSYNVGTTTNWGATVEKSRNEKHNESLKSES